MRAYRIKDTLGEVFRVSADFAFENNGTLIFRRGERGNSELVASFSSGSWLNYVAEDGELPLPDDADTEGEKNG